MTTSHRLQPQDLATTFAALGDQRRLAIVARLQEVDALSVSSLCEGMEVSRQANESRLEESVSATEAHMFSLDSS